MYWWFTDIQLLLDGQRQYESKDCLTKGTTNRPSQEFHSDLELWPQMQTHTNTSQKFSFTSSKWKNRVSGKYILRLNGTITKILPPYIIKQKNGFRTYLPFLCNMAGSIWRIPGSLQVFGVVDYMGKLRQAKRAKFLPYAIHIFLY